MAMITRVDRSTCSDFIRSQHLQRETRPTALVGNLAIFGSITVETQSSSLAFRSMVNR
jgi:hypothetical protein